MPHLFGFAMPHLADPAIAAAAAVLIIDHILHEVRRAVRGPVYQVPSGPIALCQGTARAFGWLQPVPSARYLVAVTDAGLKALAAQAALHG